MYHAGDAAPATLPPSAAIAISAGAVGTFYLGAGLLAGLIALWWALVLGQLLVGAIALGTAWLFAGAGPRGALRVLGLRWPRALHVLAGALLGASLWYVGLRIVDLVPWGDRAVERGRALTSIVQELPLGSALVVLALLPGVCEELIFRGVLARGLASRWHPALAVGLSALLFSGYHLSAVQAIPTLLLGLALGTLALRTRSLVPGMLAHVLNNASVIVVARDDGAGGSALWLDGNAAVALAGALVLAGTGLALLKVVRPA